jgi:hypothetical protein
MSNRTDGIYNSSTNISVIAEVAFCVEVDTIHVYVGYTVVYIPEIPGQTSRFHYGSKVPAVTITVFKYMNKIGQIVVKAVPYSVK